MHVRRLHLAVLAWPRGADGWMRTVGASEPLSPRTDVVRSTLSEWRCNIALPKIRILCRKLRDNEMRRGVLGKCELAVKASTGDQ
jgi:hypothetical protein